MKTKARVVFPWRLAAGAVLTAVYAGSAMSAEILRTQDGKPDFSGYYDTATITPLERPPEFQDKLTLTAAEAQAFAERSAARLAAFTPGASNDPNREAPPVGGDGSPGAAGNVGGYNTFWLDLGESSFMIDGKYRTSIITDPPNGRQPPRTPEAGADPLATLGQDRSNEGRAWWVHEGDGRGPYDDPEMRPLFERCIVGFTPTAPMLPSGYNNHKRIVQTPRHVMILTEMVHDARIVRMNGEHAPPEVRKWMGDSIGWWEGDTLVVDTTNFHPENRRMSPGASPDLHLVERFTPMADGSLLYSFTVDDPATWTAPWSGEYPWPRTQEPVYEYACHEGNYSFGNILRGARRLEADERAAAGLD